MKSNTIYDKISDSFGLTIQIVEHCNLNCAGCLHFSPIADEHYITVDRFRDILERIKLFECTGIKFNRIGFLGGEPTLHPNLPELIEICSKILPQAQMRVLTNGLISKINSDRWKVLSECFIKHNVTVKLSHYGILNDITHFTEVYDMKNFEYNYLSCNPHIWNCNTYINWNRKKGILQINDNGDLYFCCIAGNVWKYNNKNEVKFHTYEGLDYVNIFDISPYNFMQKLFIFYHKGGVKNNIPFCKYCSKPQIKEWHLYNGDDEWIS